MKYLIFLFFLISSYSFGQTYYGYKNRSYNDNYNSYKKEISCEEVVDLVEQKGRYLDVSFGGYRDEAIEKIRWYEYENNLYCIVYFKTNIYKGYIYGGWKYSFDFYYDMKKYFEKSESKGKFFWDYIEPAKIKCN